MATLPQVNYSFLAIIDISIYFHPIYYSKTLNYHLEQTSFLIYLLGYLVIDYLNRFMHDVKQTFVYGTLMQWQVLTNLL